jgi:hypothetical protein
MIRHSVSRPLLLRLLVFIAPALVLAYPATAHAGYVQQTFTLDQSNTFADGIMYGTVKVEAYDGSGSAMGSGLSAGQVRFTVTLDKPSVYGPLNPASGWDNFGMDKFAFDTSLHVTAGQISGPSGWSASFGKAMDGFGKFSVELAGGGNSRVTTGVFTITGITGLDASHMVADFEIGSKDGKGKTPPEGSVFFAAHVGGFPNGSNFIGGNTDPPPQNSPEPTTLALTLVGAAGLGLARYLRRKQSPRPRTA